MDIKRKASEGIVAIPAKKSKNELALRYGARNDFDENVSIRRNTLTHNCST